MQPRQVRISLPIPAVSLAQHAGKAELHFHRTFVETLLHLEDLDLLAQLLCAERGKRLKFEANAKNGQLVLLLCEQTKHCFIL